MAGKGPRNPHPPPSQPSAMVPEASLFFGGRQETNGERGSAVHNNNIIMPRDNYDYQNINIPRPKFEAERIKNENNPPYHNLYDQKQVDVSVGCPLPAPQRSQTILKGIARPATEFSTIFDHPAVIEKKNSPKYNDIENCKKEKVRFVDYVEPVTSISPISQNSKTDLHKRMSYKILPKELDGDGFDQKRNEESPVPPEILKVLDWQNSQLKLLQQQVKALLQASPQNHAVAQSLQLPSENQLEKDIMLRQKTDEVKSHTPTQCSVSTNTSMLWPDIQQGLEKLKKTFNEDAEQESEIEPSATDIQESAIQVDISEDSGRSATSMNIDLPDYPASECSPDLRKQSLARYRTSWESPVLGESVSMYEEEQIQGVYNDILAKVNRLLVEPDPALVTNSNDGRTDIPVSMVKECPTISSDSIALCNRLRQLGVSFINPEDLDKNAEAQLTNEVSALFIPRAACPSNSVWQQSADTSLEISSLALKYLDEEQLSKLAIAHTRSENKRRDQKQEKLDVNFSLSSKEFLDRYGLNNTAHSLSSSILKTDRKPLSSIQNDVPNSNLNFELREEVWTGNYPFNGQRYIHVPENTAGQPDNLYTNCPSRNVRRMNIVNNERITEPRMSAERLQVKNTKPEVKNRILDITAIKNQPKLL